MVRMLRAGTLIRVKGSPLDAALSRQSRLALTAVEHLGINNLPEALGEAIAKRLGPGHALLPCSDPEVRRQAEASGYGNRFEGLPADTPWRPAPPAPRPPLSACTATAVGALGQSRGQGADEIHTDALGRVRVRLHWQQGERADDRSTCWLRVVQAYAGAGMGAHFIPRVGQEVPLMPIFNGCSTYDSKRSMLFTLLSTMACKTFRHSRAPGFPSIHWRMAKRQRSCI